MRLLCLSYVALIAIVGSACSGDDPVSVSEPGTQQPQASEPPAQQELQEQPATRTPAPSDEADRTTASSEAAANEVGREGTPPADESSTENASPEQEAAPESEPQPADAAASVDAEQEDEAPGEPLQDLTEVPATVVKDADVRIRPGLAWRVIDRLESGASVTVLQHAAGWYRIRSSDEVEGWIRETALDLGAIDASQVLNQPAAPLIADWRGEHYGVLGQSADGVDVRLLEIEDEASTIIGAPIDEVTLVDADVTLEDLPILIGDETVVFPGDDFRVGQGKILPKANEWMWLPWGWLLAHNDTHIWQWRPETDELEFIERPPGFARLSPDGRYLAIANLCPRDLDCSRDNDVLLIPLDGSPRISFSEELKRFEVAPILGTTINRWNSNLDWSRNSRAVKLLVPLFDGGTEPSFPTTLVFHVDGQVVRFEEYWKADLQTDTCHADIPFPGSSGVGGWEFHDRDTIASRAECVDVDGNRSFRTTVFTLTGDFVRFDPPWTGLITDEDATRLRSARGGDTLGEHAYIEWSPSRRHALVTELQTGRVWLYSARHHNLRTVVVKSERSSTGTHTWPHFDPDEDLRGWQCCDVNWFNDDRAVVFSLRAVQPYSLIQSGVALDLSTAEGVELDVANARISVRPTGSWEPHGESFQIVLGEAGRPELGDDGVNLFPLLIFGSDGALRSALFTTTGCRQLDAWGRVPRYRADWSIDGKRFAVGGHEPLGSYVCPAAE